MAFVFYCTINKIDFCLTCKIFVEEDTTLLCWRAKGYYMPWRMQNWYLFCTCAKGSLIEMLEHQWKKHVLHYAIWWVPILPQKKKEHSSSGKPFTPEVKKISKASRSSTVLRYRGSPDSLSLSSWKLGNVLLTYSSLQWHTRISQCVR